MTLSSSSLNQETLETHFSVGQFVQVAFPNSTLVRKDGISERVHHPKKPANTRDGIYEILRIDDQRQIFFIKTINGESITTAKRGYIKDFKPKAVATS
tara:strand:- start:301 stop:594 length:294 start_codon:yes stop_codon:yes gene_type:complete